MKKKQLILLPVLFCITQFLNAQFILKGKIEFEKTVNVYKQMDFGDDGWAATLKKTTPEYKHTYFDLVFSEGKTLYHPGERAKKNQLLLVKDQLQLI